MNLKKTLWSVFIILILLSIIFLIPSCTSNENKPFEFTLLYGDPKTELSAAVLTDPEEGWISRLEKSSNGRIKISMVYYAGQLIADPEVFDAIVRGTADIAINTSAFTPGRFPTLDLLSVIPLGEGSRCLKPSSAAMEVWRKFPKEYEMGFEGVKLLEAAAPQPNPPGSILGTTKKPVRTLEDFKGLKITVPGRYNVKLLKAFGASPVMIPPFEQYTALQKGIIDSAVLDPLFYEMVSLKEVIKYQTNIAFGGNHFYIVMNEDKWNSLPKDIQDVFMQISGSYGRRADEYGYMKKQEIIENTVRNSGLEIIDMSEEEMERLKAIEKPLMEEHIANHEAEGLPAKELWAAWIEARKKYNN